jgi:hypothetical protein
MDANVIEVCDETLNGYLKEHDLFTEDFPTDTGQLNAILDGSYQVCYSKSGAGEHYAKARLENRGGRRSRRSRRTRTRIRRDSYKQNILVFRFRIIGHTLHISRTKVT